MAETESLIIRKNYGRNFSSCDNLLKREPAFFKFFRAFRFLFIIAVIYES